MTTQRGAGLFGAVLVASLAIVVSFVTSAVVASKAYLAKEEQVRQDDRELRITGSAKKRIISDWATWEFRIRSEAETLVAAYEQLTEMAKHIDAFLVTHAFPDDVVTREAIETDTVYKKDHKGNETNKVESYRLSRRYRVGTSEAERVDQAAGKITDLIQLGVHLDASRPEFIYTKLADLKIEIVGLATADARERADQIAQKSKCRIGVVKEARAGVLQITTPWSTDVSSEGRYDTSTIEKDITSVVHLLLTIEPQ